MKGIPVNILRIKVENSDIYKVLNDNYDVIQQEYIYAKILEWLFIKFRGAFLVYPKLFGIIKHNKDAYLKQIFYLLVPSLWERFFTADIVEGSLTEDMIMNAFFIEIKLPQIARMRLSYTYGDIERDYKHIYIN